MENKLVYQPVLKRVQFDEIDAQRLAELREILQRQSAKRLTDSDAIRHALILALSLVSGGGASK